MQQVAACCGAWTAGPWCVDRWSFCTPLLWCLDECSKLLFSVVLGPLVLGAWTGGPFALPCYGAWMNLKLQLVRRRQWLRRMPKIAFNFREFTDFEGRRGSGGFLAMPLGIEN